MQSQPEKSVIGWLDRQIPEHIWLPSVVVFEVRYGLALLEPGARRAGLEQGFERMLRERFELALHLPCWVGPKDESVYVYLPR